MALTIAEADDVNRLLDYILGIQHRADAEGSEIDQHNAAGEAAGRLADKAHARLGAGVSARRVLEQWSHAEFGPWRDDGRSDT